MSTKITEEDILFVLMTKNRKNILRYLCDKKDRASTREISRATGISVCMSVCGFQCRKLTYRNMVEKRIVSGKAMWKISEKGLKVIQEVDKREDEKSDYPRKLNSLER